MVYSFFWVILRRLNLMCRLFGTLFHLYSWRYITYEDKIQNTTSKMEQCSETSAHKI